MSPRFRTSALMLAVLAASPFAHAARQDGLVAYFTFDDPNNPLKNSAPASEGMPDEGKKIGDALEATFAPGKFGNAASFKNDGTKSETNGVRINDWAISLGNLDKLYAGNFTLALWFRFDGPAQSGVIIGDKEGFNVTPGWSVSQRYAKHYSVQALGASVYNAFTAGIEKAGWTHLVMTVDRTEGVVTFYINGGKETHKYKLPSADAVIGSGTATVIGASSNGTFGAKATVDEVALWNRVLSKAEIEAIGVDTKEHVARRIPEASSFAWLGAGTASAGFAAWKRRRRKTA